MPNLCGPVAAITAALLAAPAAAADDRPADGPHRQFRDDLIDKLAGDWHLSREIRGKRVENRVNADWVLNHQFLRLHMTDAASPPAYEAIVLIGYQHADKRYVAHWCDTYGGKFSAVGYGRRAGDAIAFEFQYPDGPFFNTFTWDPAAKTWTSRMESQGKDGKRKLFAVDTYRRPDAPAAGDGFAPLFPDDGPPKGWRVTEWSDLAKPAPAGTDWTVKDGVLTPGRQRGTWLVSEKEYADFVLEFEIKLGERGNSGVALRAPPRGDPAFDGMELQFADLRYNTQAKDSELTGGVYRAIAPTKQVYKPTEWNSARVELRGSRLKATINGEVVQDVDLSTFDRPVKRHDGTDAPPVKDRPRKGHLGFQHLSRNNEPIQIRNARIKELE